eukprot:6880530-Pyramimonas_sp.AAC.1
MSCPRRELNRRPQWQGSRAVPRSFRHTRHTLRGPMGNPTENHNGKVRKHFPANVGTPLTRFVAQ